VVKVNGRFLHLTLNVGELPFWRRISMLFTGQLHVLLHRRGEDYRVVQVTATDPTKRAVNA
jgi:hypothetical protein